MSWFYEFEYKVENMNVSRSSFYEFVWILKIDFLLLSLVDS